MSEEEKFDFEKWSEIMKDVESGKEVKITPDSDELDQAFAAALERSELEEIKAKQAIPAVEQTYYDHYFKDLKPGDSGQIAFGTNDFGRIDGDAYLESGTYEFYIEECLPAYRGVLGVKALHIHIFRKYFGTYSHYMEGNITSNMSHYRRNTSNPSYNPLKSFLVYPEGNSAKVTKEDIAGIKDKIIDAKIEKKIAVFNVRNRESYAKALRDWEIKNAALNSSNIIKEACEMVMGEDWDFQENFDHAKGYNPGGDFHHRLILRFPLFKIENSNGASKMVKEMYLAVYFRSDFRVRSGLVGKRAEISLDEYNANWGHSHMNGVREGWADMCLGSGTPLNMCLANMGSESLLTVENMMKLLVLISQYIRWESLEGGPYNQMSNIRNTSSSAIRGNFSNTETQNVCNEIIKIVRLSENQSGLIAVNKLNNHYRVNLDEENLKNFITNKTKFNSDHYCYVNAKNEYFNLSMDPARAERDLNSANANMRTSPSYAIPYKGALITTKVTSINEAHSNAKQCLNPHLFKAVVGKIENDLNKYYLKITKDELITKY